MQKRITKTYFNRMLLQKQSRSIYSYPVRVRAGESFRARPACVSLFLRATKSGLKNLMFVFMILFFLAINLPLFPVFSNYLVRNIPLRLLLKVSGKLFVLQKVYLPSIKRYIVDNKEKLEKRGERDLRKKVAESGLNK